MSNSFSKEERVAFEDILEGFDDALVLSRNVSIANMSQQEMERSNDTIWRPQPYIATSIDAPAGTDISTEFTDATQLTVPSRIGFNKTVPWTLTVKELRDKLQEGSLGKAAKQKLASDINVAVMNVASLQGSMVVARPDAATGFDDVALCEAIMNEQGVMGGDRYLALSTRDYNGMAGNLAGRQNLQTKSITAYERAYVGQVASFETYKLDYANRLAANAVTATMNTTTSQIDYVPLATVATATGTNNIDNRYQQITTTTNTGTAVGDCFTIAGIESVHHITKQATGQPKTFRVISVDSSTTMTISPPIISASSTPTDAELQYKNCEAVTVGATAAITFLNIVAASANPFWHKDAIELMPGRYQIDSGSGAAVMRASTDQGIELVMTKQFDINTNKFKYRMDTLFGVNLLQPEMAGVMLFGQT
tara:strand:- start:16345 stop:17613 length:1269 start_codon:yes stop_codon:yes gene_type:complete